MANEVVISSEADFALDKRDDLMRFDLGDYCSVPETTQKMPVIFILGQSNADGMGYNNEMDVSVSDRMSVQDSVKVWHKPLTRVGGNAKPEDYVDNGEMWTLSNTYDDVAKKTAQNVGVSYDYVNSLTRHGTEQYIANRLYELYGESTFVIVKCAIYGSEIEKGWGIENATAGKIWDLFQTYCWEPAKAHIESLGWEPTPVGTFWMQGEGDTSEDKAPLYEDRLQILVDRLRAISADMPIVIGGLSTKYDTEYGSITKQAQKDVATANEGVYLLPTDGTGGFPEIQLSGDGVHYSTDGLKELGESVVDNWIAPHIDNQSLWLDIEIDGEWDNTNWIIPYSDRNSSRSFVGYDTVNKYLRLRFSDDVPDLDFNLTLPKGDHKVRWIYNGINVECFVDDVSLGIQTAGRDYTFCGNAIGSGYNGGQLPFKGDIYNIIVNGISYINNGDFGSSVLPSIPSGNDGTIVGATWWKKGVDQYFTTAQLFKSQLPVVPVEFQNVTDINVGIPPTGDPYWEAYDENWLNVSVWSAGTTGLYKYRTNLKLNLALEL